MDTKNILIICVTIILICIIGTVSAYYITTNNSKNQSLLNNASIVNNTSNITNGTQINKDTSNSQSSSSHVSSESNTGDVNDVDENGDGYIQHPDGTSDYYLAGEKVETLDKDGGATWEKYSLDEYSEKADEHYRSLDYN